MTNRSGRQKTSQQQKQSTTKKNRVTRVLKREVRRRLITRRVTKPAVQQVFKVF